VSYLDEDLSSDVEVAASIVTLVLVPEKSVKYQLVCLIFFLGTLNENGNFTYSQADERK
jgi:hypothetical protein